MSNAEEKIKIKGEKMSKKKRINLYEFLIYCGVITLVVSAVSYQERITQRGEWFVLSIIFLIVVITLWWFIKWTKESIPEAYKGQNKLYKGMRKIVAILVTTIIIQLIYIMSLKPQQLKQEKPLMNAKIEMKKALIPESSAKVQKEFIKEGMTF